MMRGIGFRAHTLPSGRVPASTKTPRAACLEPSEKMRMCVEDAKASGSSWKHASVSGFDFAHSRYW